MHLFAFSILFAAMTGTLAGRAVAFYRAQFYRRAFIFCFFSGMACTAMFVAIYIEVFILQ